ncbi:hypothetical protein M9H77_27091 [Catharanthus roseus]|uniref:Uncharacterized protein n=1 Tax=Catharanthus roseus TaxID=4058 RepID=A0ACC0AFS6_CATRO|nr:hypothetical protein M9H77_27091 [Catharanthus roseus]
MSVPKIETDRFDGKSDFVMWRRKMKAVLVQNKIAPAICSPEEYPESWKDEILKEKLGHMKNKCFKRIKDEKQRKRGKGGNKVDKTHEMETVSEPSLDPPQEPEINSESSAPSSSTLIPETSDHILDAPRHSVAANQRLFTVLVTVRFQLLGHLFDFLPVISRRQCN